MTLPGSTESCTKGTRLCAEASRSGACESCRSPANPLERQQQPVEPTGQAFLQPTHIAFVYLDSACEQVAHRPYHGAAQFMQPSPGRLIALQAEYSLQPQRAGTVLLGRYPPHGTKPNWQRGPRVLGDCSGCRRGLTATSRTLEQHPRTVHDLPPPQRGHRKPSGHRSRARYAWQASSVAKAASNSVKSRGYSSTTPAHYRLWSPESSRYPSSFNPSRQNEIVVT